ncbi:MAG: chitobiase/beta-hexosaminidase C-terminal domain-containing protein [Lachnospiraceae bacterium]|nr:chitobiase/beta-hexosaminidase C-terminal domain-containing protein [Lachnospiraceae bacterium]
MKCQKCGAEIPEGKIYCAHCGAAIQMVPDYSPEDDIAIGAEKEEPEKAPSEKLPEEAPVTAGKAKGTKRRYVLCAVLLIAAGFLAFQAAYSLAGGPGEVTEEPEEEEPLLLAEPTFSVEPGTYNHSLQVVITHEEAADGHIYYTTDGTTPDADSTLYNRKIYIDEGTTVLRAVFIRNDGVQSMEADGTYEIVFIYPDEPVFSMPSGEYAESFYVTITAGADSKIYYTTDGQEPDRYSSLYTGAIQINPGLTVLQAIAIDSENRESGIEEVIYQVAEPEETEETEGTEVTEADPAQTP